VWHSPSDAGPAGTLDCLCQSAIPAGRSLRAVASEPRAAARNSPAVAGKDAPAAAGGGWEHA
jgi:hypothetical protein